MQGRGIILVVSLVALAACGFDPGSDNPSADAGGGGADAIDALDAPPGEISYIGHTVGKSSTFLVNVTPAYVPGGTYVLAVSPKPFVTVNSVSGLGATWTLVAEQCGARSQTGVSVYIGRNPASAGTVVVSLSAAPENVVAAIATYSGSAHTGTFAMYNALDAATCNATSTSIDVDAYTFPIAATNRIVGAIATRGATHTPGDGLTQRLQEMQGSSGSTAGVAIVDGLVTSVAGKFGTEVDVAGIAVELRP